MTNPQTASSAKSTALVVYQPRSDTVRLCPDKRIESILKRSFELQKIASQQLRQFGQERIFVLFGTSTAGKTSIIHQLKREDPKWFATGVDLAVSSYDGNLLQRVAPEQFQRMAHACLMRWLLQ